MGGARFWKRSVHAGWFFVLLWLALAMVAVAVYLVEGE
jgi:hypothetical protein